MKFKDLTVGDIFTLKMTASPTTFRKVSEGDVNNSQHLNHDGSVQGIVTILQYSLVEKVEQK